MLPYYDYILLWKFEIRLEKYTFIHSYSSSYVYLLSNLKIQLKHYVCNRNNNTNKLLNYTQYEEKYKPLVKYIWKKPLVKCSTVSGWEDKNW